MRLMYTVVYENGPNNLSAYVPDLPGCVSVGKTLEELRKNIREAITFHIGHMIQYGESIPEPKVSISEALDQHNENLTEIYKDLGERVPEPPAFVEVADVDTPAEAIFRDHGQSIPEVRSATITR